MPPYLSNAGAALAIVVILLGILMAVGVLPVSPFAVGGCFVLVGAARLL